MYCIFCLKRIAYCYTCWNNGQNKNCSIGTPRCVSCQIAIDVEIMKDTRIASYLAKMTECNL